MGLIRRGKEGKRSSPNIGVKSTLDKIVMASFLFPPASPTHPCPSPCYRTQRIIVVVGGKDEEN